MEVLSSSFLPKSLQLTKKSSVRIYKKPQTKTKSHYKFSTHQPIKELISYIEKLTSPKKSKNTPSQWSLATVFKSLDDFICTSIDLPLHPSVNPNHVLTGNFSPVQELPPFVCEVVEGSLPSCLDGAYIRNGPNPQFIPRGPYHLFDGDGMLHMIKISKGKATFCSRYVKTYKYIIEHKMGYTIFPSPFSSFNGPAASMARSMLTAARILTRQFNPMSHGFGLANTSVALIGGQLFALGESDLPYRLKITLDGDIITLGRHDFFSDKPFISMTAHPKIDLETGEAFAFRYHVIRPFLTFFRIDSNGKKQPDVPVFSMKSTSLIHDLGVSKNYVIFADTQIVMDLLQIIKGKSPARVDTSKVPRIGFIPKYAEDESEMRWIEVPGFNMMHCFNAWEDEDEGIIVIVASNLSTVEQALERVDMAELVLEKITVNVKEKTLQRHLLSSKILDMGCINPAYAGKKNRYAYASVVSLPMKLVGVVKLDLSVSSEDFRDCTVAHRQYGPSWSGSEPTFVPREPNNPAAEEDDGYLVAYVHDENTQESKFLVMDAKSPTLEIIAAVKLPGRVPSGFHGLFVKESDLNKL